VKKLVPLLLVTALAGCAQKPDITCNGDDAKQVVNSLLKETLTKQVTADFSAQTGNNTVDGALIRATIEKVGISLEDVMTTKNDPSSTKQFCKSSLKLALPTEIISNADAVRAMLSLNNAHQGALQAGVEFDANSIKSTLEYGVQPTDDGKKIYASTDDTPAAVHYAAVLIEQALQKTALEKAKAEQAQQQQQQAVQEQQQQADIAQAQAQVTQATLQKAKTDYKMANDALNVVWSAGNKAWRQSVLPEQRLWLTQRENDCKIKAINAGASDPVAFQANKLNCAAQMTIERVQELKTALLQNQS
jgi:hypothetical protein